MAPLLFKSPETSISSADISMEMILGWVNFSIGTPLMVVPEPLPEIKLPSPLSHWILDEDPIEETQRFWSLLLLSLPGVGPQHDWV